MSDLSLVIDPGGQPGIRPGINLRVFPAGDAPAQFQQVGVEPERLSNSGLSSGGFEDLYDFTTEFYLDGPEFNQFMGLMAFLKNRRTQNLPWEVVVYNLVTPFTEMAASRTRFKVPSTAVIEQVALGNGLSRFTYWVAVQGAITANWSQIGSKYQVDMRFQEGTFLSAGMEP
jgi:hypothetical protein